MGITRIGAWILHPDLGVLRGDSSEVRLNAKTLHVLLVLLDAGDRGVPRSELLDRVWGSTYPNDAVVSRAISDLRSAFGEKAGEEKYLRTLPKFGYQLVAEVGEGTQIESGSKPEPDRNRAWAWIAIPVVIAAIAFTARQFYEPSPNSTGQIYLPPARPMTSAPGLEQQPRFVPESDWVVYTAIRSGQQDWDLFRVNRSDGGSQPVAVTPGVHEHGPAPSPNGEQLAYVRFDEHGCEVVIQPLVLGVPEPIANCTRKFPTLVDWSSNGELLAYTSAEADDADGFRRLHAINTVSGEIQPLSVDVTPTGTDFYPRFSPDNNQLAFLRGEPQPDHRSTLWVLDLASRKEMQITRQPAQLTGMTWLNPQEILYGFVDSGRIEGRVIDLQKDIEKTIPGFNLIHPEYKGDERLLIGARQSGKRDLYLLNAAGEGQYVAASTGDDFHGRLSPDENWIAYVSGRSGFEEIWIANTKNQNVRRLTNFEGATVRYPDWHPGGNLILFSAQTSQGERLFEADVISGAVNQLSVLENEATMPRWLPDGESWVHGCRISGDWGICISNRQNTRLIASGFYQPQPLDQDQLAVVDHSGALYRLSVTDGGIESLWRGLHPRAGWSISGSKLVYATAGQKVEESRLVELNLETGVSHDLFHGSLPLNDVVINIGQKSGAILFTRHQQPSDDLVIFEDVQLDH